MFSLFTWDVILLQSKAGSPKLADPPMYDAAKHIKRE